MRGAASLCEVGASEVVVRARHVGHVDHPEQMQGRIGGVCVRNPKIDLISQLFVIKVIIGHEVEET